MFGNVTALEELHVAGKYRTEHDAHMLQAQGCGVCLFQERVVEGPMKKLASSWKS
jgi:hypothetical protein